MPQSKLANLNKKPTLALTIGDPAGIGPEIVIKILAKKKVHQICQPVVIGTKSVLDFYLKNYSSSLPGFNLIDVGKIKKLKFGKIDADYGRLSYEYIKKAVELVQTKQVNGLVTAPISKEALQRAGLIYSGHTEILSNLTGIKNVLMLMVNKKVKVAMVTRHLPLKNVAKNLTQEKIFLAIKLGVEGLKKYFSLPPPRRRVAEEGDRPHIAVCALNPHAGEGGVFGKEEKEIIIPAIEKAKKKGYNIYGPYPADTVFQHWQKYDLIIALYHDQAMLPLKLLDPYSLVNVTLGLPFIRTSPGHGTAFDIAGKNIADERPMFSAVKLAAEMYLKSKNERRTD